MFIQLILKDLKELKNKNISISVETDALEDASYYASDVFEQYHGLNFIRQVIRIDEEKTELLHIFVDVAKNGHSEIRKAM